MTRLDNGDTLPAIGGPTVDGTPFHLPDDIGDGRWAVLFYRGFF